MKVRIGDDGILRKTVNGKEYAVNCSQSSMALRVPCGIDCAHCNEGVQQRINQQTGQVLAQLNVVIITCTMQQTVIPLDDPIIQPVRPDQIPGNIREN